MKGQKWKTIEARYDHLNTKKGIYEADILDPYQFPIIQKEPHNINRIIPFMRKPETNNYAHFYLDDYQFERVWNKPLKYLNILKAYEGVFSPDFSLYTDYPIAVQIWNTYRNRWCGRYWQENGIKVVPTIVWSTPESYDFCFNGIEQESTVTISSVGVLNNKNSIKYFKKGYKELINRINPSNIIWYGELIHDMDYQDTNIEYFPSFSKQRFTSHLSTSLTSIQ